MYTQDFNPVSDSLGLTAIFAALPVITLFVLLGGLRMKAQWAALISLGVAMLVALIVYGMPADQTLLSASEGATFGLFPIMWIVIAAIWVYNMTVETGHFAVLQALVRSDLRRPARAGGDRGLLLRRAARGARRLRHPRGDHRGDADRARLPADQGGLGGARGQHRPGGLRGDRHADHHAQRGDRAAQGRPRRDGRPPDAGAGADRAADPRLHGRRQARRPPGLAGGRARRRGVRGRPVPLRQLLLGRAHGHRGLAARDGVDRRLPARVVAVRAAARRRRRALHPAGRGRRLGALARRSSARSLAATTASATRPPT